jgi:hypothetical protein
MEVRRTVPVALDGDSDDAALLEDIFLWSAQCVVDHAFQVQGEYVTTSKTTLDDETYDDVREKTDGFNGGLVQAARNKAVEACKSVVERWKQGKKASKPTFTSPHIVYDKRTVTFDDDDYLSSSHDFSRGIPLWATQPAGCPSCKLAGLLMLVCSSEHASNILSALKCEAFSSILRTPYNSIILTSSIDI